MAENENITGPPDLLEAVEAYYPLGVAVVAELVQFECRFAALVWLHRTVRAAIEAEVSTLRALEKSGRNRVPGWAAESDAMLTESIGLLEQDVAPIGAGATIAACCSALESLLTDLLPAPPSRRQSQRGLVPKARALAALWSDADAANELLAHVAWLADRRNSFAHRLVDEGGPWDESPQATRHEFDQFAVEEAFERTGEIAAILNAGYEQFARHRDIERQR